MPGWIYLDCSGVYTLWLGYLVSIIGLKECFNTSTIRIRDNYDFDPFTLLRHKILSVP